MYFLARVGKYWIWRGTLKGNVFRAADAEERAIQKIRALGQEVLRDWVWRLAVETSVAGRRGENSR
jgi:hypothetical protein